MKNGYVGLLACASGILIGLGISRLDLTGYLEKTQEQEGVRKRSKPIIISILKKNSEK